MRRFTGASRTQALATKLLLNSLASLRLSPEASSKVYELDINATPRMGGSVS
jgi:hypothetical protein